MALVIAILLAIFVLPSPWGIVAIGASAIWELGEAWLMLRWSQRRRAQVGVEALVGKTALVALAEPFQVTVKGERWQARGVDGPRVGEHVVVQSVDGLVLVVARGDSAPR